jgi:hypothetical protein
MGKKFWLSKTFWANVIALAAIIVQSYTGFVIEPEKQLALLGIVNVFLRFVTKEAIIWDDAG